MSADSPSSTGTSLFVNFEQDGNALVARLVGPNIGQREAGIITEAFGDALATAGKSKYLLLDMSQVSFMNSMGIGMLVVLRGKAAAKKMKLVMGNVRSELEQLLKMVRLDKLFTICATDEQLRKAMKR